ncbi:MAG TPA: EAL domain-containing protein [Acidimicrobiales bacterium]|nr:EAL domain-containing protein [Acidimicrobiales bacterium]HUB70154.1 EAL domain-containing protein [Acidimicrobiales bacterium]
MVTIALEKGGGGLCEIAELLRKQLRLDAVCIAEMRHSSAVFRAWAGKGGIAVGTETPLEATYLELLATGRIPGLIPDAASEPLVANLPLTRWLGARSFVGVPLKLSNGSLYGVLAGAKCSLGPVPGESELRAMEIVAGLVQRELDEQRRLDKLRTDLAELIDHERARTAYQPIIELTTGRCLGLEALSRFDKPFTRPETAFAAADETGLSLELERLAICKAWRVLEVLEESQFLAVNVSPASLLILAEQAIARPEVDLSRIVVEVTEHAIVERYDQLRNRLRPLRRRGLRLSVDDVGAGYASLHHVVELRPDFIKLDISLVRGVAEDSARRVTIGAFAQLSGELGATVVAEGVETQKDLDTLRSLGIGAGQGYLLASPSESADDVSRWVSSPSLLPPGLPLAHHPRRAYSRPLASSRSAAGRRKVSQQEAASGR